MGAHEASSHSRPPRRCPGRRRAPVRSRDAPTREHIGEGPRRSCERQATQSSGGTMNELAERDLPSTESRPPRSQAGATRRSRTTLSTAHTQHVDAHTRARPSADPPPGRGRRDAPRVKQKQQRLDPRRWGHRAAGPSVEHGWMGRACSCKETAVAPLAGTARPQAHEARRPQAGAGEKQVSSQRATRATSLAQECWCSVWPVALCSRAPGGPRWCRA